MDVLKAIEKLIFFGAPQSSVIQIQKLQRLYVLSIQKVNISSDYKAHSLLKQEILSQERILDRIQTIFPRMH